MEQYVRTERVDFSASKTHARNTTDSVIARGKEESLACVRTGQPHSKNLHPASIQLVEKEKAKSTPLNLKQNPYPARLEREKPDRNPAGQVEDS
ncbi:hypothetical protein ZHAS_00013534 [Anopheles sinensis]|uniref:Uncharacterized protein n=1 Tax=Anopheles sinensis TaxID=74873 RepID=A0A084W631_ANOSI|nr:hypothetical protein ZHAS_00013534 [Anopheles sinensis]